MLAPFFTADTQYYEIADNAALALGINTSFAAWVYPIDSSGALQSIFTDLTESPITYTSDFRLQASSGLVYPATTGNNVDATVALSTKPLPLYKWTHLAITTNGSNTFFKYNGVLVDTIAMVRTNNPQTGAWRIGRCLGTGGGIGTRPFSGGLYNMTVWARPITIDECRNHMQRGEQSDAVLSVSFKDLLPVDTGPSKLPITVGGHPRRLDTPSPWHEYFTDYIPADDSRLGPIVMDFGHA